MDGNGRWAKARGKNRAFGHREGVRSVREIVEVCGKIDVKYLTLYTFSTENWKRPKDEVSTLMRLLVTSLKKEVNSLHKNNVRFTAIGDLSKLPVDARNQIQGAIEKTAENTGLTLVLALSYSARWDMILAMRKVALDVRGGKISPEDINESVFETHLSTADIPDPDLLIRTSGELRLSNFLLWELAYTELYISECFWPDFRIRQLYEAVRDFQSRERRFGMISEQLNNQSRQRKTVNDKRINAISSY